MNYFDISQQIKKVEKSIMIINQVFFNKKYEYVMKDSLDEGIGLVSNSSNPNEITIEHIK